MSTLGPQWVLWFSQFEVPMVLVDLFIIKVCICYWDTVWQCFKFKGYGFQGARRGVGLYSLGPRAKKFEKPCSNL